MVDHNHASAMHAASRATPESREHGRGDPFPPSLPRHSGFRKGSGNLPARYGGTATIAGVSRGFAGALPDDDSSPLFRKSSIKLPGGNEATRYSPREHRSNARPMSRKASNKPPPAGLFKKSLKFRYCFVRPCSIVWWDIFAPRFP